MQVEGINNYVLHTYIVLQASILRVAITLLMTCLLSLGSFKNGLGLRVGLGFRVQGLGFGLSVRIWGEGGRRMAFWPSCTGHGTRGDVLGQVPHILGAVV